MTTATNVKRRSNFTPHDYAVYRVVWTLNEHERSLLDRCFMLKTSGHHLLNVINSKHDWKDILTNNDVEYEVVYQECSNEMLDKSLCRKPLLLSFRYSRHNNFAVVLVKEPYANADLYIYKELV